MASRIGSGGIVVSNCFSLKTRSDCRSNRTNAVFRGVAIEFGRCLQQSGRISVTDKTFGHELAKSPRSPIQGAMPPSLLAKKKERSGLQSACDELIDKGAIHHSE
jgi:hypothetical protein